MPAMVQTTRADSNHRTSKTRSRWWRWAKITILVILSVAILYQGWIVFSILRYRSTKSVINGADGSAGL